MRINLSTSVIAVTGAGSGLGQALATELAGRGALLALCDLSEPGLAETARRVAEMGGQCSIASVDVAAPEEVERWARKVMEDHGRVDGVISNAGVVLPWTPVEEVPYKHLRRIVDVNLWGAVHCARSFLPALRNRPASRFVAVASLGALVAFPDQVGYCTSKFALRGFAEGLAMDLAKSPVRVTLVLPGGMRGTGIMGNALGATAAEADLGDRLEKTPLTTPAPRAARRVVAAMESGRPRVVVGPDAAAMSLIGRLFPARYPRVLGPVIARYQRQFTDSTNN